jgi:hypothetical protein
MAEMTITCPHCSQRITCDELWGGHTLPCPTCHKELAVPAPAPVPAAATSEDGLLVPKVPQGPPKLVMGPKPSALDPAGPRVVPIRNLAPPPPKKSNRLLQVLAVVLVLIVLGVAAYVGYPYIKGMLQKSDTGSSTTGQSASGGGSAPLQEVNAAMDIADSPDGSTTPTRPASDRKAAKQPAGPPAWTLDLAAANIPDAPVSGSVASSQFKLETARFDTIGGVQVLRLLQGSPAAPDLELSVYLPFKPGEALGGQSLTFSPSTKSAMVPQQIIKRWKVGAGPALQMKTFSIGYALKLTLDQRGADGLIPGKVFLALPDTEQSFVAGTFKAPATGPAQPAR